MKVSIYNPTQELIISGGTNVNERLTTKLDVIVTDTRGNVLPDEIYFDSNNTSVCDVDEFGVVTAIGPGTATVIAAAAISHPCNLFTPRGLPFHSLQATATITVKAQPVALDYSLMLYHAGDTFTIYQRPVYPSVFTESVRYLIGKLPIGTIDGGRGELRFTGHDATKNFTVTGVSESGNVHHVHTSHGNPRSGPDSVITYPICSVR